LTACSAEISSPIRGLVALHDSSLVLAGRVGLVRQEKPRAGDDASGRQGAGQEVQSRHGSDEVAAGLASLSDQTVGAPGGRRARLLRGTDHHKHKDPGIAKVLDEPALFAECQHDGVHASIDADPDVVATDEGHQ
jgi:osmotically-inducible protein OsmY